MEKVTHDQIEGKPVYESFQRLSINRTEKVELRSGSTAGGKPFGGSIRKLILRMRDLYWQCQLRRSKSKSTYGTPYRVSLSIPSLRDYTLPQTKDVASGVTMLDKPQCPHLWLIHTSANDTSSMKTSTVSVGCSNLDEVCTHRKSLRQRCLPKMRRRTTAIQRSEWPGLAIGFELG